MFLNFVWAFLNTFSNGLAISFAVVIISRNILPNEFIELSTLATLTTLGNVFIDFGNSSRCYLKKRISNKSFKKIESNMLSRMLLIFPVILIFCFFLNYFNKYNNLLIFIFLLDNILFYFIFRPNIIINRRKLFKLRTKYSLICTIIASICSIFLSIFVNGKWGFVSLLMMNPTLLCIVLRKYLNLRLPEFNIELSLKSKDIFKKEFLFQVCEHIEEFLKKIILQQIQNINLSGIYLRNESFLFSPLKIINKSLNRVVSASWGPIESSKLNKFKKLTKLILLFFLLVTLFYYFFGSLVSNIFLGNRWEMNQLFFSICAIIIGLKFLSLQLSNMIKVKLKDFNFILNVSIFTTIVPLFILFLVKSYSILTFLVIYLIMLLLKNIIFIFKLMSI